MAITDAGLGVIFQVGEPFHDHIITDFYLPIIADARNNSAVLWSMLPRTSERVAGKFIKFPVRTTRNLGGNAIRPGGDLPDAGRQGSDFYAFEYRHYYHRLLVDGPTMDAARLDAATYLDLIDTEVNGAMDDITIEMNRMVHNDGSGRLGEVVTEGPNFITMRVNGDIEGALTCDSPPTRFISVGMRLGFTDSAGNGGTGSLNAVLTVVSVDSDTQVTLDADPGAAGVLVNDWVVHASNLTLTATNNAYRAEPMGIAGIYQDVGVLDGNGVAAAQVGAQDFAITNTTNAGFQGIATTAGLEFNQAIVRDNAGVKRPITEALLQQAFSDAEETNNANIDLMLTSYATYNSYIELLTPDKRYNNTLDLQGGHKVLSFNGVGFVKDRFCYGNRVYIMAMDQFRMYEVVPLEWLDFHGQRWDKLQDKDAYQAGLKTRFTMGVDVRNRTGALVNDLID